jgi:bacillithiol system protein YtxJ
MGFDRSEIGNVMNWKKLENLDQLTQIKNLSKEKKVLIFKHSTSCSISRTALDRLERNWKEDEMHDTTAYYLDLRSHREVSNQVADTFGVEHQSPQVLIIKDGESVYDSSHFDIDYNSIRKQAV